ncbi:SWIM zinc finger family protein, partial [Streptomyces sp. SID7804]
MTEQGVRWTVDQVLALAPDSASRTAGSRLGAAGSWSGAGRCGEGTVWGLCEGGGSGPYRTVVDVADPSGPAYRCSCPSRKVPCKHALGLLLLRAGAEEAVPRARAPEWVREWISGRRATERRRTGDAAHPAP